MKSTSKTSFISDINTSFIIPLIDLPCFSMFFKISSFKFLFSIIFFAIIDIQFSELKSFV